MAVRRRSAAEEWEALRALLPTEEEIEQAQGERDALLSADSERREAAEKRARMISESKVEEYGEMIRFIIHRIPVRERGPLRDQAQNVKPGEIDALEAQIAVFHPQTQDDWKKYYVLCCSAQEYYRRLPERAGREARSALTGKNTRAEETIRNKYSAFWSALGERFYPVWRWETDAVSMAGQTRLGVPEKDAKQIGLWAEQVLLPSAQSDQEELRNRFGRSLRREEGGFSLSVPYCLNAGENFTGYLRCSDPDDRNMKGFIRGLLYQILLRMTPAESRVIFLDSVFCNPQAWQPFGDYAGDHGFMAFPTTGEEQMTALNRLEQLNPLNRQEESASRWLIAYGYPEGFSQEIRSRIEYLLHNSRYNGINVLLCSAPGERRGEDSYGAEYALDFSSGEMNVSRRGGSQSLIRLLPPIQGTLDQEAFEMAYSQLFQPDDMDFLARVPLPEALPDRLSAADRFGPVTMHFAVDKATGELSGMTLAENAAFAYIAAPARSGKSIAVHMMLADLMTHRHPDDLELWLMELKGTEYDKYAEQAPPHVRYILTGNNESETMRFVQRLMDMIEEEIRFRIDLCNEYGCFKVSGLPDDVYCPQILIIIDEYGVIQQYAGDRSSAAAWTDITRKLDHLLMQGATYGIRCIFTNQVYEVGGLNRVDSIPIRMGMGTFNPRTTPQLYLNPDRVKAAVPFELERYHSAYDCSVENRSHYLEHLRFSEQGIHQVLDHLQRLTEGWEAVPQGDTVPWERDCYCDKVPVFRNRDKAYRFNEVEPLLRRVIESKQEEAEGFLYLHTGIPCSFMRTKSIRLSRADRENILLTVNAKGAVNRTLDQETALALLLTARMNGAETELWTPSGSSLTAAAARYGIPCFSQEDLPERMKWLEESIGDRRDRFVVLMDAERMLGQTMPAAETSAPAAPAAVAAAPFPAGLTAHDLIAGLGSISVPKPVAAAAPAAAETLTDRFCRLLRNGPDRGCRFVVHINRMDELSRLRGYAKDHQLSQYLDPGHFAHFLSARLEGNDADLPSLVHKHALERARLEEGLLLYTDPQNRPFAFTPIDFGLRAQRRRGRVADE